MIEALQAGLTASALFLFAIMIVALLAIAAAPVMKEAWTGRSRVLPAEGSV